MAGGIIVYFDELSRRDFIRQRIEGSFEPFSDALSVGEWDVGHIALALLCFSPDTIDYICLVRKGRKVVTSKSRFEFYGMVGLEELEIEVVERRLGSRLKHHLTAVSRGNGGVVPAMTWLGVIDAIKVERPSLTDEIERLLSLMKYSKFRISGGAADLLVQEREALGISLDIFSGGSQLRSRVINEWAPDESSLSDVDEVNLTATLVPQGRRDSSFLNGIPQRFFLEESAIQHDLFNWPGMSPSHQAGVTVFEQGGRRLEVHYANRNSLEHTLGVDLIYYNEGYGLFVLVQYKLMREEGLKSVYRPDAQLREELNRMDRFYQEFKAEGPLQRHQDFRMCEDGFVFKFVPNRGLQPSASELIKGMYVTREYLHFLIGSEGPRGSRGGTQISFDDAPRYLTNSQFSDAVNSGWLGTRGVQSTAVFNLIRDFYESGRALMVSYESNSRAL